MATIKFVLKNPKSEKPTPILALIRFDNKRVNYSIGYSINPNYWDSVKQMAIEKNSDKQLEKLGLTLTGAEISDNKTINTRIGKLIGRKSKLFSNYEENEEIPTTKGVKKDFDKKFRPPKVEKPIYKNFNKYIDQFIKDIETGERLNPINAKQYSAGTVKMYKGFQSQLNEYQEKRKRVLDFDDIDIEFYWDYVKFFEAKDYSTNTIGRHIKTLKVVMGTSQLEKLHNNNQFRQKDFKGMTEKVSNIYLTLDELETMYKLDLSNNKELETARDVFLVGCFTSLRFSDYSRIKPQHIQQTTKGTRIIKIQTKKTGEEVEIPFWHWILDELIDKYPEGLPKTYEQKVNKRIKKVGKKAKITQSTNKMVNKQGTKYEVSVPKNELIKTHTARRSGATNMYKHGIPTIDIMKITGHTLESNFFKYIKVTKEETADRITEKYRINKPLKKVE